MKRNANCCEKCYHFLPQGKNLSDDKALVLEHIIVLMNAREKGSLTQPKRSTVTLWGVVATALLILLDESDRMGKFYALATSSLAGLKELRCIINFKIRNNSVLKNKISNSEKYQRDRTNLKKRLVATIASARTRSMTIILSRADGTKPHSM